MVGLAGKSCMEIGNLRKTLFRYNELRTQTLEGATIVLSRFRELGIQSDYSQYVNKHYEAAKDVLKSFTSKGLTRYDLFRISGFVATEENLSNALASIIDPNRPHKLGILPLQNLLKTIQHRDKRRISSILETLKKSPKIQVHRELNLRSTIPDIAVMSNQFIIFIENKLRTGIETGYKEGNYQTNRQWEILQKMGERFNIPEIYLLGIYLTPQGKQPANQEFVRISVSEVIDAIRNALKEKESPFANTIESFLISYDQSDS